MSDKLALFCYDDRLLDDCTPCGAIFVEGLNGAMGVEVNIKGSL